MCCFLHLGALPALPYRDAYRNEWCGKRFGSPLLPVTPSFARVVKKGCQSKSEESAVSSIILPLADRVTEMQNSASSLLCQLKHCLVTLKAPPSSLRLIETTGYGLEYVSGADLGTG